MLQRVLCPVLVGQEEPLFALEDALLAAHSGDSRFVLLGGEAGMEKTRLARRVAGWLTQRGLAAAREEVELKGLDGAQPAWRLSAA